MIISESMRVFYTLLAFLFIYDAVWVGFTNLTATGADDRVPQYTKWATVNLISSLAIILFIWSNLLNWEFWPQLFIKRISVVIVAVVGTIYDYKSVWYFYYPKKKQNLQEYDNIPAPRPAPPPKLDNGKKG